MFKNKAITKSEDVYYTDMPVLRNPEWSTDGEGNTWRKGGYGAVKIPTGIYKVRFPYGSPPYLQKETFSVDNLLELPSDPSTEVLIHILDFWSKKQAFRDFKFTYKRGIMLYGPPGSGKSVTIYRLAKHLEDNDAIMIMAQSADAAEEGIGIIKSLEPDRKIVVVFEDIDGIIRRYGDEEITHLLDGGKDVDGVLFIATTNYPERIPARVINRPSRFDVVIEIGMPDSPSRRVYIRSIIQDNLLVDIDSIVEATDGLSIAEIKEVLILTQIFGHSLSYAVNRFKNIV